VTDELQRTKTRLENLARNKPTPKSRAEVEALLRSKWTGVQVSAANVLAEWGGPDSVAALRRWLSDGGLVRDAVKALGRCVSDDDVGWGLDLHFRLFSQGWGLTSWPLVIGLPRATTVERLVSETKGGSEHRRAAEVALRWIAEHDNWLAANPRTSGQRGVGRHF
jgi:HEAT repeat protein